jgi:hypothetical protein
MLSLSKHAWRWMRAGIAASRRAHARALRRRVSIVVAALLMAALPTHAGAQSKADPVALAKAKELMQVSNLGAKRDQMVALVEAQIAALVRDANPGDEDKVDRAVADVIRPALKRRIPEYLDLAAGVYADHFTRAELEQLVLFYKSPLGQKLVREQGDVIPAITEMSKQWVNRVGNEVLKDAADDFAKRGLKAPGA